MVRSRVALAVVGMLIIGGIAAAVGAASAIRPGGVTAGALSPPQTTATATAAVQASPTATATRTPRPTPTSPPIGVVIDLHGRISSVGAATAGTFVLSVSGGASYTVQTSPPPGTTYTGTAHTFGDLRPEMVAEVKGEFPAANAAFQAIEVNAQPDN